VTQSSTTDDPADAQLAPLREANPDYRIWAGIGGLLYARKLYSSPPIVLRAYQADSLTAQIARVAEGWRPWFDRVRF
jgi:hypothetical protein